MSDIGTLPSKYQISIPKRIRESRSWTPGHKSAFLPEESGILLVPQVERGSGTSRVEVVRGSLARIVGDGDALGTLPPPAFLTVGSDPPGPETLAIFASDGVRTCGEPPRQPFHR